MNEFKLLEKYGIYRTAPDWMAPTTTRPWLDNLAEAKFSSALLGWLAYSVACLFLRNYPWIPGMFSSPKTPLFRPAASTSCRQRKENAKRSKSVKASTKRRPFSRPAFSVSTLRRCSAACVGNSNMATSTVSVNKQSLLHLNLPTLLLYEGTSTMFISTGPVAHSTAPTEVEDGRALDVDDGTLVGHDHDV